MTTGRPWGTDGQGVPLPWFPLLLGVVSGAVSVVANLLVGRGARPALLSGLVFGVVFGAGHEIYRRHLRVKARDGC